MLRHAFPLWSPMILTSFSRWASNGSRRHFAFFPKASRRSDRLRRHEAGDDLPTAADRGAAERNEEAEQIRNLPQQPGGKAEAPSLADKKPKAAAIVARSQAERLEAAAEPASGLRRATWTVQKGVLGWLFRRILTLWSAKNGL